ncbi:GGDEF domain-containing protein [Vibrio sp. FNV 38]|nr:GGDEF domain-containing protein [Vibrio sp. FNV 38]
MALRDWQVPLEHTNAFEHYLASYRTRGARELCILGGVLYLVFGIIDIWGVPSALYQVWLIRTVVASTFLVVFCLTYKPFFLRQYTWIILGLVIMSGGGIEMMIYLTTYGEYARFNYYAGLLLVVFATYIWVYLPFWLLLVASTTLFVGYLSISILHLNMLQGDTWSILLSNCFFFIGANLIGAFGYIHRSQTMKENFLHRQNLISDLEKTEQKAQAQKYRAEQDSLTGLPNRAKFYQQLDKKIEQASTPATMVAVLYLDLDGFKQINDSMGHNIGDQVLCIASRRIKRCIRSKDLLARIGGDEFVCILTLEANQLDIVSKIAQKMIHSLERKIAKPEVTLPLSASIGIAFYPQHAHGSKALTDVADAQMYVAKKAGKGQYSIASFSQDKAG